MRGWLADIWDSVVACLFSVTPCATKLVWTWKAIILTPVRHISLIIHDIVETTKALDATELQERTLVQRLILPQKDNANLLRNDAPDSNANPRTGSTSLIRQTGIRSLSDRAVRIRPRGIVVRISG